MDKASRTSTKPGRNEYQAAAARMLRASNASGSHDSRTNRQRTRATAKSASLKEYR